MTAPTSPKPHTPADLTVSKDPATTLDNGAADAGLRTALEELADDRPGRRVLRALLAAHPPPSLAELRMQGPPVSAEWDTHAVGWHAALDAVEALLAAHPAPAPARSGHDIACDADYLGASCICDEITPTPVSDTRREDVDQVDLVADTLAKAFEGPHCAAADLHGADCTTPGGCYYHDAARAVLAVLPAPPVVDDCDRGPVLFNRVPFPPECSCGTRMPDGNVQDNFNKHLADVAGPPA